MKHKTICVYLTATSAHVMTIDTFIIWLCRWFSLEVVMAKVTAFIENDGDPDILDFFNEYFDSVKWASSRELGAAQNETPYIKYYGLGLSEEVDILLLNFDDVYESKG